ncbi:MAG: hypothetical protein V1494_06625 [Candidatus Diapherotrites archaeon]
MAEEKKSSGSRTDSWFDKLSDYVTGTISGFVAFLFFLFAAGAVYGALIVAKGSPFGGYLIVLPAVLGLITYYSRDIALVVFVFFLLFLLLV